VSRPGDIALGLELLAVSFSVLVQELTLIRWLPAQVRVLAYFPNLILLASFLGLGIGCLRAGRRSLLPLWPAGLLVVALLTLPLSRVVFTQQSEAEHLFALYYDLPPDAPRVEDVRLPIIVFFLATLVTFLAPGQLVAERLEAFRRRGAALVGYLWDIGGSLAGVVAFTVVSFLGTPPVVWFGVFLAASLPFFRRRRWLIGQLGAAAAVLVAVAWGERGTFYSPYYAITVNDRAGGAGFELLTNGSLHQYAFRVARSHRGLTEMEDTAREGYHAPYRFLVAPPRRALVLGAGTGNDVAVLLDQGAERVDAVEIDPVILRLGRERHPDRPYSSDRVRVVNGDARSFLNNTRERYDLIVFGTLDSLTRLSALSNVRLENFVYTAECVKAARDRLTERGGIVLYALVGADYVRERLNGLLAQALGEVPLALAEHRGLFNRTYMAGPAFSIHDGANRRAAAGPALGAMRVELPSDDWPFLYLRSRGISSFYLTLIALFAGVSVLGVLLASKQMRQQLKGRGGVDLEMFLFGAGFLLLETRAVTEMCLSWSATWVTSAVVFAAILATVFLGTVVSLLHPVAYPSALVGLVLSLLASYAVPSGWLLGASPAARLGSSLLFVGGPVFFASLCFATAFREREETGAAFGWNLLGALAGGLLEFAGMAVGLRSLLLVALVAYLGAALVRVRGR
jgi:hypothetical protein